MRPHPGRAPAHVLLLASTVLLAVAVAGCGSGQRSLSRPVAGTGSQSPGEGPAGPGTTTEPSPGGSQTQPGQPPTTKPPVPAHPIEWYLARLPTFPAAPPAEQLPLPHQPGEAAWVKRIPTTQRIAFLTIDDGYLQRPEAITLLRAAKVPVTLFLTVNAIKSNTGYFEALQQYGARIEAHTLTHRNLKGMAYADQKREICGSADYLGAQYGRRPTLFRPPYGEKDDTTLKAAQDCGIKACFFWTETVNTGIVRYQVPDHRIKPGDILLMHFREAFADDFLAALQAIKAAGLTPALLENYVKD